ncbi:hypothetical protein CEXT_535881 [Caerostris extrusa]|uniref:Uncharacterized protein n=1 Tax=Caerostris extrusa TaxID=172846 RepID=A0AAV4W034_CAEEX|nr:hypothetical protein CEXT_535881 [Caerostris extrusa]
MPPMPLKKVTYVKTFYLRAKMDELDNFFILPQVIRLDEILLMLDSADVDLTTASRFILWVGRLASWCHMLLTKDLTNLAVDCGPISSPVATEVKVEPSENLTPGDSERGVFFPIAASSGGVRP